MSVPQGRYRGHGTELDHHTDLQARLGGGRERAGGPPSACGALLVRRDATGVPHRDDRSVLLLVGRVFHAPGDDTGRE
jgi:hypothetical protein